MLKDDSLNDDDFEAARNVVLGFKSQLKASDKAVSGLRERLKALSSSAKPVMTSFSKLYQTSTGEVGVRRCDGLASWHDQTATAAASGITACKVFSEYSSKINDELHALRNRVDERDNLLVKLDRAIADDKGEERIGVARQEYESVHGVVLRALQDIAATHRDEFLERFTELCVACHSVFAGLRVAAQLPVPEDYSEADMQVVVQASSSLKEAVEREKRGKSVARERVKTLERTVKDERRRVKEEAKMARKSERRAQSVAAEVAKTEQQRGTMIILPDPEDIVASDPFAQVDDTVVQATDPFGGGVSDPFAGPASSDLWTLSTGASDRTAVPFSDARASSSSSASSSSESANGFAEAAASMEECHASFAAKAWKESLRHAMAATVALADESDDAMVRPLIRRCVAYAVASRLQLRLIQLDDLPTEEVPNTGWSKAQGCALYANASSTLPLQAQHRVALVKAAVRRNVTAHNFATARQQVNTLLQVVPERDHPTLERLLNSIPKAPDAADRIHCTHLCYKTLLPIESGTPAATCDLCAATYAVDPDVCAYCTTEL